MSAKKSIGAARRRSVASEPRERVRVRPLLPDRDLPVVVEPGVEGLDLADWVAGDRSYVEELLASHRALLFRDFPVRSVSDFERFVSAVSDAPRLEYRDRTTPRTTRGERIYTSTVHPPDQRIELHNEGTYWMRWPRLLFFCALKVPAWGGATPIADVRGVYRRITPEIRGRFAEKQMMLVRNYNDGFGLSWQEVYQTEDRGEVEAYCRANDIAFEWKPGDRLRTRSVRPAVRTHPRTGEPVWFNHAAFFHYTSLESGIRESLLAEFGVDGLPYNTCYGDGTPIEDEVADALRAAYAAEKVIFPWLPGDVMLLDNMSVAHAREPFSGEREVLVAMTDAIEGGATAGSAA